MPVGAITAMRPQCMAYLAATHQIRLRRHPPSQQETTREELAQVIDSPTHPARCLERARISLRWQRFVGGNAADSIGTRDGVPGPVRGSRGACLARREDEYHQGGTR